MKLHHLPTLCAVLLALSPGLAPAQTTAVPNFISYQGRVVDSQGNNVGAGTPVNRTVIFRIWDNPSSTNLTNLIYSETQTVTVSEGEFSVLVGQGVANATNQNFGDESLKKLTDFAMAFNGSARYLGVTVAASGTIGTTDNEITPRQQIVSTAFAMRAKFAESISSSSDLALTPLSGTASNYGLGWYGTGRLFGTTAVDGPVLYGNAGGALGSNVSGAQKIALLWDASGRVGIGATSITSATNKLTLQGDMGASPSDQLAIRGNTDNNKRLLLGYDTTANKASLQSYTAASTTGPLLLNPSGGNVGINNALPGVALDVTGAIKASGDLTAANLSAGQLTASNRVMTNSLEFWGTGGPGGALFQKTLTTYPTNTSAVNGEMVLMGSPKLHLATANNGAAVMTLWGSNVGIGTTTPTEARLVIKGQPALQRPANLGIIYLGTTTSGAGNITDNATYLNQSAYLSIFADKGIHSSFSLLSSDERIKKIVGRSDRGKDLQTLQEIEVTDYFYKDVYEHGLRPHKKVIAQQVERVFPQAVSRSTLVVPDIYEAATFRDGWTSLKTDLKVGDRVRLISESEEGLHEVLEVKGDSFRTAFQPAGDKVFVYGREVDDFRSVDYDAISMLNVSATQQLKLEKDAEIQALRDENATLRRELAAKDAGLEARLIALERRLANDGAAVAVSMKKATAAE